jgi:hypothetical protein
VLEYLFCLHKESFEKSSRLLLAIKKSNSRIVVDWMHKKILMIVKWFLEEFF